MSCGVEPSSPVFPRVDPWCVDTLWRPQAYTGNLQPISTQFLKPSSIAAAAAARDNRSLEFLMYARWATCDYAVPCVLL
jgi:hypothetical protein